MGYPDRINDKIIMDITKFDSLSEKQKEVVFSSANKIVVRACPGSGKTFTIAACLGHKFNNWPLSHTGIASISFTNVAWQEIEKYLPQFGVNSKIKYPHFLGTIDSFVNQYIFLPFGHFVMKCNKRPMLVGEPYSKWDGSNELDKYFEKLSYNLRGEIVDFTPSLQPRFPSRTATNSKFVDLILRVKKSINSKGYATQNDANYFALQVLKEHPKLMKHLAKRFSILLVDEAQDTTEIQMAIFRELLNIGVQKIILVGDPDQAIFEWNTANPKIFNSICTDTGYFLYELDECLRSSQKICNFVFGLSSLSAPVKASSPKISNCEIEPLIIEYSSKTDLVKAFLEKCKQNEILLSTTQAAILSRTKKGVSEIYEILAAKESNHTDFKTTQKMWKQDFSWCENICEGKFLIDHKSYKEGHKLIERGYYKASKKSSNFSRDEFKKYIDECGFLMWRKTIHEFIKVIPHTDRKIIEWLTLFDPIVFKYFGIQSVQQSVKRDCGENIINEVFDQSKFTSIEAPVRIGTIHSVKGETFEAVLVVIGSKVGSTNYSTILERISKNDLLEEELRTLYVGLTRPRRLLMLGVPVGDKNMWKRLLR